MTVSTKSKLALAAVATLLAVSAYSAGSEATAADAPDTAGWSAPQVRPGSNLQDMLDLYALKRQLAAVRREQPAISAATSGFHECASIPRGRTPRVG